MDDVSEEPLLKEPEWYLICGADADIRDSIF